MELRRDIYQELAIVPDRELILDGSGRSFDSIPLEDQSVSEIVRQCHI